MDLALSTESSRSRKMNAEFAMRSRSHANYAALLMRDDTRL
jgi:hypothetical protein